MNRFKKMLAVAVVAVLGAVSSFAIDPTEIVTITGGVPDIHPEFITNQLLTMQGKVIMAVVGMLVLGIGYRLIVRKSSGACK
jgi:hypothetical protein